MVELIKTEYPRQILNKIVESVRDKISCALVYGSYARNSGKPLTNHSDVDFVLIFKSGVNPFPIVREIERTFEEMHVFYDLGWFTEERFLELSEAKVDLCLWWSLFRHGEILYSEREFLEQVYAVLHDSSPIETFDSTHRYRRSKIRQLAQAIVRNLHRVVIDAIWVLYYKSKHLSSWNELPNYYIIVEKALTEGVIKSNIALLAERLEKLRKAMDERSDKTNFGEIPLLWEMTNLFINQVLEERTIEEIDDNLAALLTC